MKAWEKPEFEKITKVRLPFDRRHKDDFQNYGVHGTDLWFILKGPKGAIQYGVTLPCYLPHVKQELEQKGKSFRSLNEIRGFDVGYHSPMPVYEGQEPMREDCEFIGGKCYYDGSSLRADDWTKLIFSTVGEPPEETLWKLLFEEYEAHFGKVET